VAFANGFGNDGRGHALRLRDAGIAATEYAACLTERQPVRAVRAFFELLDESAPA